MKNDFLTWLYKYRLFASLEKLTILKTKYLQNDHDITYFHITGTNGKGSVSRYLNQVLTTIIDDRVALFTSPHISKINERIVVDNKPISDSDLMRIKALITDDVEWYQLGFFAILTLIALIYFQEQKVKWAIIEVGIGGKLDSTNIIKSDYVVLTSLSYDHEALLGKTLTAILEEKLAIIKTATTKKVFVTGTISNYLQKIIKQKVTKPLFFSTLKSKNYLLNNQNLALLIVQTLFAGRSAAATAKIIKTTKNDLRFQKLIIKNKVIYLDVAHNIAAIKAVKLLLEIKKIKIDKIIFSSLLDKHPKTLIKLLKGVSDKIVVCCNPLYPRSIIGVDFDYQKMIFNDLKSRVFLITGSCYFVAAVFNQLNQFIRGN